MCTNEDGMPCDRKTTRCTVRFSFFFFLFFYLFCRFYGTRTNINAQTNLHNFITILVLFFPIFGSCSYLHALRTSSSFVVAFKMGNYSFFLVETRMKFIEHGMFVTGIWWIRRIRQVNEMNDWTRKRKKNTHSRREQERSSSKTAKWVCTITEHLKVNKKRSGAVSSNGLEPVTLKYIKNNRRGKKRQKINAAHFSQPPIWCNLFECAVENLYRNVCMTKNISALLHLFFTSAMEFQLFNVT